MPYLGSWKIDDYLTFCCNTHDPDTGVATDADSVPTYRVYEDETGTAILTGSTAKLDDANTVGFYSERIQLTAANGFEKGKCYTIYVTATVDSDAGTMHHNFQIEAEVDANAVSDKTGYGLADAAITAAKIATDAFTSDEFAASALNEIADAVWDEDIEAAHGTDATAGLLLRILGAAISNRANNATLHALLGIADSAGVDLPEQVWSEATRVLTANTNLNDPTAATIADAVWDEVSTGHVSAGKAGQQLWTDLDTVLADTGELQTDLVDGGRLDLLIDAIKAKTDNLPADPADDSDIDTQLAAIAAYLDTEIAAILTDTNELQTDDIPGLIAALNDPTAATIADAVWDEALSAHDVEDSIGNVLNDLAEESGGTYRFTSAALQSTLGAGAITFTYTLTSSVDSSPIASATVWVTTDQAGSNVVASGTTDTNGAVTFYLDAGTYYVWREKAGFNFTNPDTETVS